MPRINQLPGYSNPTSTDLLAILDIANNTTSQTTVAELLSTTGANVKYVAKTATYSISTNDVVVDCTANTFTVTLPTSVGLQGKLYYIKNSGVGTITVATTGGQTIDGGATASLSTQWASVTVVSDGANWKIV